MQHKDILFKKHTTYTQHTDIIFKTQHIITTDVSLIMKNKGRKNTSEIFLSGTSSYIESGKNR